MDEAIEEFDRHYNQFRQQNQTQIKEFFNDVLMPLDNTFSEDIQALIQEALNTIGVRSLEEEEEERKEKKCRKADSSDSQAMNHCNLRR